MPINLAYIEPHIYLAEWKGMVTLHEVVHRTPDISVVVSEHGDTHYVLLIDMTSVTHFPLDIHNLRNSADVDNRAICYFVIQPPPVARVIIRILDKMSRTNFLLANSVDEGIERARQYLEEHRDAFAGP